jgi:hypothetical protein
MKRPVISQREAHRLQRQVARLENQIEIQRSAYAQAWPGGAHIASIALTTAEFATVKTARRLGHAVIAIAPNRDVLDLYALPLASEPK